MKRVRSLALAVVVALLSVASEAAAQEEEHTASAEGHEQGGEHAPGIDGKTLALQLFNFGVLIVILVKFGGGAVNKALRQRHDQLKVDLEESAKLRAAAEARLKEQEKRLAHLEDELATLRANLKKEAEAEKSRLIASAEEKARAIQTETSFLLDQQVKAAELRFRAEVAAAAARVAEELIRRQVNAGDQARLAQAFVTDVEATVPQGRG